MNSSLIKSQCDACPVQENFHPAPHSSFHFSESCSDCYLFAPSPKSVARYGDIKRITRKIASALGWRVAMDCCLLCGGLWTCYDLSGVFSGPDLIDPSCFSRVSLPSDGLGPDVVLND